MTPDHIPSYAAIKKYYEELSGGITLTPQQYDKIYNDATTLVYETLIHQTYSRTYGRGRNSDAQILNESKNLYETAVKDMEAIRKPLLDSGVSEEQLNAAFERIHERNRKLGLY